MSFTVILAEERFRSELEDLAVEAGYRMLDRRQWASASSETIGDLLALTPDLAIVLSETIGSEVLRDLDEDGVRYWLVEVGAPVADGFQPPARKPHRRILGLNQTTTAYLRQLLDDWRDRDRIRVDCFTFGYRNGLPPEADWVVDTRFLDSPYWVPEMRGRSGRDPMVRGYVMAQPGAQQLVDNFLPMLLQLLPLYQLQRRSVLRLAVGCTGGSHRSVAIASEMADRINQSGEAVARHLEQVPLYLPQSLD
jgi:hypothetical protein